jgi:hypothetical protein
MEWNHPGITLAVSGGRQETPDRRENQRVPCTNEMNRNLRTVYATVRNGFTTEFGEYRGWFHEPASLAV